MVLMKLSETSVVSKQLKETIFHNFLSIKSKLIFCIEVQCI